MKTNLMLSALCTLLLGNFCSAKFRSDARNASRPDRVILQDRAFSLELTHTAEGWNFPANTASYLEHLAVKLDIIGVSGWSEFHFELNRAAGRAALSGATHDAAGNRVPVGADFVLKVGQSATDSPLYLESSGETHTCTGAPCACCEFQKVDGKIRGCTCLTQYYSTCSREEGQKCNHTVTSK